MPLSPEPYIGVQSAFTSTLEHKRVQVERSWIHGNATRVSAILGWIGGGSTDAAFTALGDTVNTAARLEGLAKTGDAALCLSERLIAASGLGVTEGEALTADLRGRQAAVAIRLFADGAALASALAAAPASRAAAET